MGYPLLGTRETWVVSTIPWPLFSRLPPYASRSTPDQRGEVMRRPSPHWLLPATDHLIDKERTGPDLGKRSRYLTQYAPNRKIPEDKIIRSVPHAAAQPLTGARKGPLTFWYPENVGGPNVPPTSPKFHTTLAAAAGRGSAVDHRTLRQLCRHDRPLDLQGPDGDLQPAVRGERRQGRGEGRDRRSARGHHYLAPGSWVGPFGFSPCPFLLVPDQRAKLDVCHRGPIWAGLQSPNGVAERSFRIKI